MHLTAAYHWLLCLRRSGPWSVTSEKGDLTRAHIQSVLAHLVQIWNLKLTSSQSEISETMFSKIQIRSRICVLLGNFSKETSEISEKKRYKNLGGISFPSGFEVDDEDFKYWWSWRRNRSFKVRRVSGSFSVLYEIFKAVFLFTALTASKWMLVALVALTRRAVVLSEVVSVTPADDLGASYPNRFRIWSHTFFLHTNITNTSTPRRALKKSETYQRWAGSGKIVDNTSRIQLAPMTTKSLALIMNLALWTARKRCLGSVPLCCCIFCMSALTLLQCRTVRMKSTRLQMVMKPIGRR